VKQTIGALVFVLAMVSSTAEAATIFGGYDCGQWVKRSQQPARKALQEAWLLGFLSGMNVTYELAGSGPRDPLGTLNSADQAFVWMDNFCQANPLRQLDGAALELFAELTAKKLQSK